MSLYKDLINGQLKLICHLKEKKVVIWDFKEEGGKSRGDGKENIW